MTGSPSPPPAPPRRLIAWVMSEFLLSCGRAWARPHDGNLTAAFIYCTILSANFDNRGYLESATLPIGPGSPALRPISAHAIAQSLSLPYETVRRRTAAMVDEGRCIRVAGGLIAAPEAMEEPRFVAATSEIRRLLDDLVVSLSTIGVNLPAIAALAGTAQAVANEPPDFLTARIVMDSQIRSLETAVPIFGSMLCGYVCTAIIAMNTRHILHDPELVLRHVNDDAPPPDELRRPITLRELARELEVPFETVRRQATALASVGVVVTVAQGGVIVPRDKISSDVTRETHPKLMLEFMRMVGNLAQVGYDLAGGARQRLNDARTKQAGAA